MIDLLFLRTMKTWPVSALVSVLVFLFAVMFTGTAQAASYVFPSNLPSGCSGAGPSYTCGALALAWNDTITINSPKPATITFNGNLNINNAQINWSGNATDLTLMVNGALSGNTEPRIKANIQVTGNASIVYKTQLTGNLNVGGTLAFGSESSISGNVNATGAVTLGYKTTITGTLTGASISDPNGACTLNGPVTANTGAISLGYGTQVTGNITAPAGPATLGGSSRVTGNVNAGSTLDIQGGAEITGNAVATGAVTTAWASKISGTTNVGSLSDAGSTTFGGPITASTGAISLGGSSTVAGNVTALAGAVTLGHQTRVNGNVITDAGKITLGSSSNVTGCASTKRNSANSIVLNWAAQAGGVCCKSGSGCLPTNAACYDNGSGGAISSTVCESSVSQYDYPYRNDFDTATSTVIVDGNPANDTNGRDHWSLGVYWGFTNTAHLGDGSTGYHLDSNPNGSTQGGGNFYTTMNGYVTIPSGAVNPQLAFTHRLNTSYTYYVQYQTPGGSWQTLANYDWTMQTSGTPYQQQAIPLPAGLKGQTVRFRFRVDGDGSATRYWAIDNFCIGEYATCVTNSQYDYPYRNDFDTATSTVIVDGNPANDTNGRDHWSLGVYWGFTNTAHLGDGSTGYHLDSNPNGNSQGGGNFYTTMNGFVTIPSGASNPQLAFTHRLNTSYTYYIQYQTPGGSWQTLANYDWTKQTSGTPYQQQAIPLPAGLKGQTVRFRFRVDGDGSAARYWAIDNFCIGEYATCVTNSQYDYPYRNDFDTATSTVIVDGNPANDTNGRDHWSLGVYWGFTNTAHLGDGSTGYHLDSNPNGSTQGGGNFYTTMNGFVTIPSGASNPQLAFTHRLNTSYTYYVQYQTPGGSWQTLANYDWTMQTSGTPYQQQAIPLPAGLKGQTVRFRFRVDGDGSTTRYWAIDNFCVGEDACLVTPPPASLSAYYKFDDIWSSGNSLDDSSGNNKHATLNGTVTQEAAPAAGSKPDTCKAGNFNKAGWFSTASGLDIDTAANAKNSVSLWMYWDGGFHSSNFTMPFSWGGVYYDLTVSKYRQPAMGNGVIGFNTGNGDVYGVTADGLANGWHHVAAVFNNGAITLNELYIDGVQKTLTSYGSHAARSATTSAAGIGAGANWGGDYKWSGKLDHVRIYKGAISSAQIAADMAETISCITGPDHYEVTVPSSNIACLASTVTVKACADASSPCTNVATTVNGTATLATSAGSLGATSLTFSSGVASTTLSYTAATNGAAATLTLSGESATATNARTCCSGSTCSTSDTCAATFNTAGFIFASSTTGASATLPTLTAGTASGTTYLRAVQTSTSSGACVSALTGPQSVNMAYQCNNPTTCSGNNLMSINGGSATTIQRNDNTGVSSYTAVSMTFDGNGSAPFTYTFSDVGQITLYAQKAASGSLLAALSGNSNAFVVKPYSFVLTDIKQTASPQTANPAAADADGSKFIPAGEPFSVTVTTVNISCAASLGTYNLLSQIPASCIAANFGKETTPETVGLSKALVTGLGLTNDPALNNATAFGSFSAGSAMGTTFSWDEVGIIKLTPDLSDNDYLGAGGSAAATQSGNIGRFTPHHFGVTGTVVTRSDLQVTEGQATPFTYMGEPLKLTLVVTAYNKTDGVTQNYAGSFAKLAAATLGTGASWFNTGCGASTQCMGLGAVNDAATDTGLSGRLSIDTGVASPTGVWMAGVGTVAAHVKLARSTAPDGPYETLKFGAMPRDSDGITLPGSAATDPHKVDLDATTGNTLASNPDGTNERRYLLTSKSRFGRLWLGNAYGSDKRGLAVPYEAQYWNGNVFVKNTKDSLTPFAVGNISLATGLTTTPTLTAMAAGAGTIALSAPNPNTAGSVGVYINLDSTGVPVNCQSYAEGTTAARSYLSGKWCGAAYDRDPVGRATFGIYGGKKGPIYIRENY